MTRIFAIFAAIFFAASAAQAASPQEMSKILEIFGQIPPQSEGQTAEFIFNGKPYRMVRSNDSLWVVVTFGNYTYFVVEKNLDGTPDNFLDIDGKSVKDKELQDELKTGFDQAIESMIEYSEAVETPN